MISHGTRLLVHILTTGSTVLVGCSIGDDGEDAPSTAAGLVLAEDEVPGATSSDDVEELETLTICGLIGRPEGRLSTFADSQAVREVVVDPSIGATTVTVAVYEGISAQTREVMIFAPLEQGVETCSQDSPLERGSIVESMTPLTGLPDGAVGYSSQLTDQGTPEAVERAYASVNGHVIVVGAQQVGGDETGVGLNELLSTAIEKVERLS